MDRILGSFKTTSIGFGEMPLTIENNLGHDIGIETIHAALMQAALISIQHGHTIVLAARNKLEKSLFAKL